MHGLFGYHAINLNHNLSNHMCDMWIGLWSGCYGFGTEHSLGMAMPASMIHVSLCSKNLAEQWRYVVVIEGGGLWGGLV